MIVLVDLCVFSLPYRSADLTLELIILSMEHGLISFDFHNCLSAMKVTYAWSNYLWHISWRELDD